MCPKTGFFVKLCSLTYEDDGGGFASGQVEDSANEFFSFSDELRGQRGRRHVEQRGLGLGGQSLRQQRLPVTYK